VREFLSWALKDGEWVDPRAGHFTWREKAFGTLGWEAKVAYRGRRSGHDEERNPFLHLDF
jgi:hypothetical protein